MATLKYSRQREAIKAYLCKRKDHPTADMIYTGLREKYPNISLGTVYRNLSLLISLGEIRKINSEGADRYDGQMAPHSHFICKNCGSVQDVMFQAEDSLGRDACREIGIVEECQVEFYGFCKKCSTAGAKNRLTGRGHIGII